MNKLYLILIINLFLLSCRLEKRLLLPPNLGEQSIFKKIDCYRPIRKYGPRIEIEERRNNENEIQIIAHNYGHGGGGWSLAPGSAKKIVEKLDDAIIENGLKKDEPITILGAGIIGLYSCLELLNQGYRNITIIAENFDELASNHAGGLWSPFHVGDISDKRDLIIEIGIYSYNHFLNIAKGKNKRFIDCARIMPAYFKSRNKDLEIFVGTILKPAKHVIIEFGNGHSRKMYVYDDIMIMNTPLIMEKLTEILKRNNVKFIQQKINSFDEVKTKIVINCTGYGAKKLCNDDSMISFQGHLLVLRGQNPKNLNYLLTVPFEEDYINGHKIDRLFYIIPKHAPGTPEDQIGVIGGTLVEGVEKDTINEDEFPKIMERAKKFYGIK